MSYFSMQSFGLTEVEAQALVEAAKARAEEVVAIVGSYSIKCSERTKEALDKAKNEGKIEEAQIGELVAIRNISLMSPEHIVSKGFTPSFNHEHGFFTEHESFACLTHSLPTSTHPSFVGTPTMDSSMVNIGFSRAELGFGTHDDYTARLREGRKLTEIDLSTDQFAGLMRDSSAGSPCAIGREGGLLIDQPPRMVSTVNIASQVKREALMIVKPVVDATNELIAFASRPEKISTKADYAELEQLAKNVQIAMDTVRKPLRDLLANTAGMMAESSTKQLLLEITEPLKRLGMSQGEVLSLMHF